MLSFEVRGNPRRYPHLIFLHGFLGSRSDFFPLIKELQKKNFCIAIDLPAHGLSPKRELSTLDSVAKTIEQLANRVENYKPLLIGYSMGGRIALQLSQRMQLAGVAVLSGHPGLLQDVEKDNRLQKDLLWKEKLQTLSPSHFLKLWYQQKVFYSLKKKPLLHAKLLQERLYNNPLDLCAILEEMSLSKQTLIEKPFSCPTHFFAGEEDATYKALYHNRSLDHTLIPKAGHTVLLENPSACAQAIRAWAESI